MGRVVAIVNESTCVTDAQLEPIVAALQIQVTRDFSLAWGADKAASLVFVAKGQPVPNGAWPIGICDNCQQAGALGYHEQAPDGSPRAWVGAEDDLQYGSSLSVTISHELLEMLADPYIDQTFQLVDTAGSGEEYCVEDCDAVEDDSLGYQINGILVSDFQLPAWFSDPAKAVPGTKYDFLGHLTAPLQLLAGGYIGIRQIVNGQPQGWTQLTARLIAMRYNAHRAPGDTALIVPSEKRAHQIQPGSRRHRRAMKRVAMAC